MNAILSSKQPRFFCKAVVVGVFFLFTFVPASHATPLDDGFDATYTLSKNGFTIAKVKRQLEIDNDNDLIIFTSSASVAGLASLFVDDTIDERSVMEMADGRIRPLVYIYQQKNSQQQQQYKITFDWPTNLVINSWQNKSYPLTSNSADLLSFQIILAQTLKTGIKNRIFTIADKDQVDQYTLKPSGAEILHIARRELDTAKLSYYDKSNKRQITFWCAKSLDFLPVRIERKDDDGDITLLELSRWGNTPPAALDDSDAL